MMGPEIDLSKADIKLRPRKEGQMKMEGMSEFFQS